MVSLQNDSDCRPDLPDFPVPYEDHGVHAMIKDNAITVCGGGERECYELNFFNGSWVETEARNETRRHSSAAETPQGKGIQ